MIMKHKKAMQEMQLMWEKAVQDHQHEYDSDEEIDTRDGTWEHRLRKMEMEKTRGQRLFWDTGFQLAMQSTETEFGFTSMFILC